MFNNNKAYLWGLLAGGFVYAHPVIAMTEPEQVIQQQQQRIEADRKAIERQQRQHSPLRYPKPTIESNKPGGPCFVIERVELKGAENIPKADQQTIAKPILSQCVDLNLINQQLRQISSWYFDRGYITSRAYIESQDLSTGLLVITVIEGFIEDTVLKDETSRLNVWTAFPGDKGDNLNLRDIEQGLENLNRLQSTNATIALLPGQLPGASIVEVELEQGKPWQMSLSRDNSGQDSSGRDKNGLFFSLDNPLGLNDFSYINYQNDNEPGSSNKANQSLAWHWDMPLAYWQFGIDISYFDYLTTQGRALDSFELSGSSLSQSVYLSRVLYRDRNSKLRWKMDLGRKKSRNLIEDTVIPLSSHVLAIGGLELDYELYLANKSSWQLGFRYERGLSLFDARQDEDSELVQKAQFDKFIVDIDYQKIFDGLPTFFPSNTPLIFESSLHLQQSSDALFSTEQISIGGLYSVRGYHGNSIAASSGAYWRNSLKLQWRPAWSQGWLNVVQPFVAIDVGAIRDRDNDFNSGTYAALKGWSVGTALSNQYLTIQVSYERPLNPPGWLPLDDQEQWHFNIAVSY